MTANIGDVIAGQGIVVACPDCAGAGWILHPFIPGTRIACDRCAETGTLLDDSAVSPDNGKADG